MGGSELLAGEIMDHSCFPRGFAEVMLSRIFKLKLLLAKIKTHGEKRSLKCFLPPAQPDRTGIWVEIQQIWLQAHLKSERIQRKSSSVVVVQIPASVRKVCSLLWMLLLASFLQLADIMMSRQSVKHVSL